MKTLKISIVIAALVGFAAQTECKTKVVAKQKAAAPVKNTYEILTEQYAMLEKNFEKLEAQRAAYEAKNPSRDEMAKLDYQIAILREKADAIYADLEEFPQFSTYEGKIVPKSPKYVPTDKEYKECVLKSKKMSKEVEKLTKTVTSKK